MSFNFDKFGQGLLSNPLIGLGTGLLTGAAPGGTFAGGAQAGLQNMMAMQQANSRNKLMSLQAQKYVSDAAAAKKKQEIVDAMAGKLKAPTPYEQLPSEMFPGEAPIPGLENLPTLEAINQADIMQAAPETYFDELIKSQFAGSGGLKQTDIASMRKEYTQSAETKRFSQTAEAFEKIRSAEDTAAGDMSLIFGYMKILDPGSTVREGEYATTEQATGVSGAIINAYNRAVDGTRLNPSQRSDFKRQAGKLFGSQIPAQLRREQIYQGLGKKAGIDPNRIAPPEILGPYRDMDFDKMFPSMPAPTMGEAMVPIGEAVDAATGLFGGESETVVTPEQAQEIEAIPAYKAGEIIVAPSGKEVKFLGGDPDDPNNYEYVN